MPRIRYLAAAVLLLAGASPARADGGSADGGSRRPTAGGSLDTPGARHGAVAAPRVAVVRQRPPARAVRQRPPAREARRRTRGPAREADHPQPDRSCHRYRGRRVCEGPRRVAEPLPGAAELASRLGLGPAAATTLLTARPPPEWVEAVVGRPADDLLFPVDGGHRWRGFGNHGRGRRRHLHNGIDIGAPEGTPIRAANDGLVAYSDNGIRGYGNLVILVHADGTTTFYGHCFATHVAPGQRVRRGDVIAEVGETGLARGTHLHFEWRSGAVARDPWRRFSGAPAFPAEEPEVRSSQAAVNEDSHEPVPAG